MTPKQNLAKKKASRNKGASFNPDVTWKPTAPGKGYATSPYGSQRMDSEDFELQQTRIKYPRASIKRSMPGR
jgi:hypothetical protein